MSDEQTFQRLKWTVLGEDNVAAAYYWALRAFPGRETQELDALVERAVLELLDEGLIIFYWGDWDGAVLDPSSAKQATRAEVEADLKLGGDADPTPETVWFRSTEAGEAKLATIPAEVFLSYEDREKLNAFVARHPEFPERQREWLQARERWVREGGSHAEAAFDDVSRLAVRAAAVEVVRLASGLAPRESHRPTLLLEIRAQLAGVLRERGRNEPPDRVCCDQRRSLGDRSAPSLISRR